MLTILALIFTSLAITFGCYVCYIMKNRRVLQAARRLPTVVPVLPVLGHIVYVVFKLKGIPFNLFEEFLFNPGYPISCVWLGPRPITVLCRLQDVKEFFRSSRALEKTKEYGMLDFLFGKGLLTAPVHLWKITRRRIAPVFTTRNVQHFTNELNDVSARFVQELSVYIGKKDFDVKKHVGCLAIKNAAFFILNLDVEKVYGNECINILFDDVDSLMTAFLERISKPWLWTDNVFKLIYRKTLRTHELVWKTCGQPTISKVVNEAEYKNHTQVSDKNDAITIPDALKTLSRTSEECNWHYMKQEVITFLGGASDTSMVTMGSCLIALGSHANVQEKLYNEIITTVGDSGYVSIEDLNKMPYLEQVLKETLRRFSPIPVITRKVEKDIQIDGTTLPEGSDVALSLASIHMDPEIYPEPQKFDPDRFEAEKVASRDAYSLLAFGGGARDCVGKQYAMIAMKINLVHIIRAYYIRSDMDINKLKLKYGMTIVSVDGYKIKIERRKKAPS